MAYRQLNPANVESVERLARTTTRQVLGNGARLAIGLGDHGALCFY